MAGMAQCARCNEDPIMSRGKYKFRGSEVRRALQAFGEATGLSPSDVSLSISRDGTMTMMARESSEASVDVNPFDVEAEKIRGQGQAA
jgi:hypothetical protein